MTVKNLIGFTALLVLGAFAVGHGQTTAATLELSRREAVAVMRRVNTAQAAIARRQNGQFGTLASVLQQDTTLQSQLLVIDEYSASTKDYKLTLVTDEGGRYYQVALTSDKPCALALFTTKGGLIYTGWALDCPAQ